MNEHRNTPAGQFGKNRLVEGLPKYFPSPLEVSSTPSNPNTSRAYSISAGACSVDSGASSAVLTGTAAKSPKRPGWSWIRARLLLVELPGELESGGRVARPSAERPPGSRPLNEIGVDRIRVWMIGTEIHD